MCTLRPSNPFGRSSCYLRHYLLSPHEPPDAPPPLLLFRPEFFRWGARHGVRPVAGGAAGAMGAFCRRLEHFDRRPVRERDRHARPGRASPQRHAGRPGAGGPHGPAHRCGRSQRLDAGPRNRGAELRADHAACVGGAGRGRGYRHPAQRGAAAGPPTCLGRCARPRRPATAGRQLVHGAGHGGLPGAALPPGPAGAGRVHSRPGAVSGPQSQVLQPRHGPGRGLPPAGGPASGGE